MKEILRTTNRFDRQYLVCMGLGVRFGSFEKTLPASPR